MRFQRHGTWSIAAAALAAALCAAGCAHHTEAPVPALEPPPPPRASNPGFAYRIQAYDELHVRFPFQPDADEQVPVRPDGRISLATTGELTAVGLTTADLEELIREKSSARLRNPQVVVVVTKVAEQHVYIGGEVHKPGYVVLMPDMTPLQAVMQCGGFMPTAKLDSVVIMSKDGGGKFAAARMDMDQVVNDGVSERVRLHPGDVVFVPRTWIADMDIVVDQYVRGLIPSLPRVGAGYSL